MNNPEDPELLELTDTLPALKKAKADFVRMSNDEELRILYYARQKILHDMASMEEQGREQGREEGIEIGIEKGIDIGIEKTKIEMAQAFLDVLDDEVIAKKTGLSIEVVRNLRTQ